jgi:DNA-binding PadR family transcriptional regulator
MSPDPKRRLPEITHLQFLVLGILMPGETSGRKVRSALASYRVRRTAPAFYQLMARLEDAGLVDGRYEQKVVEGQLIKERRYRITPAGAAAFKETREFYLRPVPASAVKGLANA